MSPTTPKSPQSNLEDLANPESTSDFILEDTSSEPPVIQNTYQKEESFIIIEKVANQLEENRKERVKYASNTFVLTCIWIFVVLAIVVFAGLQNGNRSFLVLSDKVIIVLITTSTVNVFGFFFLVMQFLFNKREMATIEFLFRYKNEAGKQSQLIKE